MDSFDFSNGSNSNDQYFHQDASRFGDWRHASKSWQPYHPSLNNYQKKVIQTDGLQDVCLWDLEIIKYLKQILIKPLKKQLISIHQY